MKTQTTGFGWWRSFLWPIHLYELKKFLPMFLLFFFINFNYTILRDTKDALLITAPQSGAEAVPFLKVWGVLPFAILFMLLYSKLSNFLTKEKIFYILITFFISFFALFVMVLYPMRNSLHPVAFADQLQTYLPIGMKGFVSLIRNWTYSLFYIMSELWGSVAISLLFWGFANDITKISESKRFYGLLGVGANCAMLASGKTIVACSKIRGMLPPGVDPWQISLNWMLGAVVLSGILMMVVYRWMHCYIVTDPLLCPQEEEKRTKKNKQKMSLRESLSYLIRSPYVLCLAILVIGYGISIQLVEVTWKHQLHQRFPEAKDYSQFMGRFSSSTGLVTIFMMLAVSGNVMRMFGWEVAAMVTPIVLLLTGLGFFSFVIFQDRLSGVAALLHSTPLQLAVLLGAVQNIMTKSCKYSLFDPTKETAYIPTDREVKSKGKAAVDVVAARFGKAGGALVNQFFLLLAGGIDGIAPYVAFVLLGIILVWVYTVRVLNKLFLSAQQAQAAATTNPQKGFIGRA